MAKLRIGPETVSLPMSELDDGRALSLIRRISTEVGPQWKMKLPIPFMLALGYKILVWRSLKGTTKVHYVV
jgi:hypothetical protein